MKNKDISRIILKITCGITEKIVDLILLGAILFEEMAVPSGKNLRARMFKIDKRLGNALGSNTLKASLFFARKNGWLSQNLKITPEGQRRLKSILPQYLGQQKWDGNWYVVAYDIPEEKRRLRSVVKEKLEELGFGLLHKSVWISPYNFLGDVEKIVKQYTLENWVILLISNKVGREPSENLARRIWGLEKINNFYKEFIEKVENKKLAKTQVAFEYLSILNQDPQLPEELLPDDWQGDKAHKIYKKFLR